MGCICSCLSNIMYFSEKFTLCVACCALVSCLICTLLCMLGLGIGLGYNYSYVDFRTRHKYIAGYYYKPGYYQYYRSTTTRHLLRAGDEGILGTDPIEITTEVPAREQYLSDIVQSVDEVTKGEESKAENEKIYSQRVLPNPYELDPDDTEIMLVPSGDMDLERKIFANNTESTFPTRTTTTNAMAGLSNNEQNSDEVNATKVNNDTAVVKDNMMMLKLGSVTPSLTTATMNSIQLLKWLEHLRAMNKSFSVQVVTD